MTGGVDGIPGTFAGPTGRSTFNTVTGGVFRNVVQSNSIDFLNLGDSVEAVRTSRFLDCYSTTKAFLGDLYENRRSFGFMRGAPLEQGHPVLVSQFEEAQKRLADKENHFGSALYALEPLCDGPTRRVLGEVYSTVEGMAHATAYAMLEVVWHGMPPAMPADLLGLLREDYGKYPDLESQWTSMRALLKRLRVLLDIEQWPSGVARRAPSGE
ncbi:hypothetical protein ACIGNX_18305 [Actinosynnema sp. NPDC053489]|uniref:hypothetical protein n=1 Tax=Actinosynnema sp. NPDC053489 TaxID=3363916 RepID=UPI0037C790CF